MRVNRDEWDEFGQGHDRGCIRDVFEMRLSISYRLEQFAKVLLNTPGGTSVRGPQADPERKRNTSTTKQCTTAPSC